MTELSQLSASVTFHVGSFDVAGWVARQQHVELDVEGWLEALADVQAELAEDRSESGFARWESRGDENNACSPVSFRRDGNSIEVRCDGRTVAQCGADALYGAIESAVRSVRAQILSTGVAGERWLLNLDSRLDDTWREADEDNFMRAPASWTYGPMFEAFLSGASKASLETALDASGAAERFRPGEAPEPHATRWLLTLPSLDERVGCLVREGALSFAPRQISRACRLPEEHADCLWGGTVAPTGEGVAFLRGVVALVQNIARVSPVKAAVLRSEGAVEPTGVDLGWIYVYAWSGLGEPGGGEGYRRVGLEG
ncbi:MAG: hypothetical protein AAGA54_36410 [Myxococcota bacterium]